MVVVEVAVGAANQYATVLVAHPLRDGQEVGFSEFVAAPKPKPTERAPRS